MSTPAAPLVRAELSGTDPMIKVVSHTGLVYWWPVWLVGFVLSGLTYLDGSRMAIVPDGTTVKAVGPRVFELTVPDHPSSSLIRAEEATSRDQDAFPLRVSASRNYGMVYLVVLLLVIAGTNAPMRGLWSLAVLLSMLLVTVLLAYFNTWDWLLEPLWGLHVEISLAGYLVPSVVLLVLWLVRVCGLDQLRYALFRPGQFVIRKDIGDARQVYDTTRVTLKKSPSDLFRHWVLGLGAGDLIIQIPSQGKEILVPNVLFVKGKVRRIAELMKTRSVTTA
jgi:hypothetical protein